MAKGNRKQFIVLHTYGSHFNYRERYPSEDAFFLPDYPVEAEVKYRDNLVNAYDNTIRYTDGFLARLIHMLEEQQVDAAMLYTSDHGEDILMIRVICFFMLLRFLLLSTPCPFPDMDVRHLSGNVSGTLESNGGE